jgi:hypothetical protein
MKPRSLMLGFSLIGVEEFLELILALGSRLCLLWPWCV